MHQNKFLKDVSVLSLSVVASRIILFIRDIMLASVLGPIYYGIWVQMVVIFNYSLHLPLGFQNVLSRDVPYFLAQNKNNQVKVIQDTTFIITLSTALLAGFVIYLIYLVFDYSILGLKLPVLFIMIAIIVAQQVNSFYSILLRAHQEFKVFSLGFVLIPLLSLLLGLVFSQKWGVAGMATALGLALTSITVYWLRYSPFKLRSIEFSYIEFEKLLKLAIPLFLIGIFGLLITSIDRLLIIFHYDQVIIGYYGFAFMVTQSIFLVTAPVMQAIYPRMMKAYGKHTDPKKLIKYLFVLTQGMSVVVTILIGVIYLSINKIILFFLPEFLPSIIIVETLLIGGAFYTLASGANAYTIAINKQNKVLLLQLVVIIVQIVIISFVIYTGEKIEMIAKGMVASYFLYAVLALNLASESFGDSLASRAAFGFSSIFLVLHLILLLILVNNCNASFGRTSVSTILSILAWLIISSPATIYVYRHLRKANTK